MFPQTRHHPPAARDTYERVFIDTVLRLNGVIGNPTHVQYAEAIQKLALYVRKVAQARARDLADDSDWLSGPLPEEMAVEHAFLFIRFDTVLRKTEPQGQALQKWLCAQTFQ